MIHIKSKFIADGVVSLRIKIIYITSDHSFDEELLVGVMIMIVYSLNDPAITKDRDPVGDFYYFIQFVGDDDQCFSFCLEVKQEIHQGLGMFLAK